MEGSYMYVETSRLRGVAQGGGRRHVERWTHFLILFDGAELGYSPLFSLKVHGTNSHTCMCIYMHLQVLVHVHA